LINKESRSQHLIPLFAFFEAMGSSMDPTLPQTFTTVASAAIGLIQSYGWLAICVIAVVWVVFRKISTGVRMQQAYAADRVAKLDEQRKLAMEKQLEKWTKENEQARKDQKNRVEPLPTQPIRKEPAKSSLSPGSFGDVGGGGGDSGRFRPDISCRYPGRGGGGS